MSFVVIFFAGAFLFNAIPHLTAGLRGEVFLYPFSMPHGKGPSSPLVNYLRGMLNALIGLALFVCVLAIGMSTSVHFGRVCREGSF